MANKAKYNRRRVIQGAAVALSALSGCPTIGQTQQTESEAGTPQGRSRTDSDEVTGADKVVVERPDNGDRLVARGPDGVISDGTDHASVLEAAISDAPDASRVYIQATEITPSRQVSVSDVTGITVEGPTHGRTEIRQTGDDQMSIFQLEGASEFTLRNLTFDGNQSQVTGRTARGLWLRDLAGGVTIENVTIRNTLHHALVVDGSGWEIRNCHIEGWNYVGRSEDGISVSGESSDGNIVGNTLRQTGPTATGAVSAIEAQDGASRLTIQDNICTNAGIECHIHNAGFEYANPAAMTDVWIRENQIYNGKIRCVGQADMPIKRFIIEGNAIKNGQIEAQRFPSIRIRNNDVFDVRDFPSGIRLLNGGQASLTDNTVSMTSSSSTASSVRVKNVERFQLNGGYVYGNDSSNKGVRVSHGGQRSTSSRTVISDIDIMGHTKRAIELRDETHARITDCLLETRSDILLNNCRDTRVADSTMIGRNGVISQNGSDWTTVVNCVIQASDQPINLIGENTVTRDNTIRN